MTGGRISFILCIVRRTLLGSCQGGVDKLGTGDVGTALKCGGMKPLGGSRYRCEDNIEMEFREIGCASAECASLIQHQFPALSTRQ